MKILKLVIHHFRSIRHCELYCPKMLVLLSVDAVFISPGWDRTIMANPTFFEHLSLPLHHLQNQTLVNCSLLLTMIIRSIYGDRANNG